MTYYFGLIIAGMFGAIFGSYSTLFAYRLPLGESCFGRYFGPKSRCPKCDTIIRTRELIPILNWLFTRGKCTSCQAKIPRAFLFIEVATSILFMICYDQFSFSEEFIIYSLICSSLVVLLVTDYGHKTFPNAALNFILMLVLVNRVLADGGVADVVFSAAGALIFATIFYQIIYKKSAILSNQNQVLSYVKFIMISSVAFSFQLFLLYFLSICIIITLLVILNKSRKRPNLTFGVSLILPFMWLMFYPSL